MRKSVITESAWIRGVATRMWYRSQSVWLPLRRSFMSWPSWDTDEEGGMLCDQTTRLRTHLPFKARVLHAVSKDQTWRINL